MKQLWFLPIIFMTLISLTPIMSAGGSTATFTEAGAPNYTSIVQSIDMKAIQRHVEYFSSLGSRMTGYPGADNASEYILNFFSKYLEDVHFDYYNVCVPIDYGAEVKVLSPTGRVIKAYPLMPNMIQTSPTSGTQGPLVYVGYGNLADLGGKKVNGSIALMDFNSANNWLNIVRFGGRAVIFIEPEITSRFEAMQKNIDDIPLNFPRLWVSREDGRYLLDLLQGGVTVEVNIWSKMVYEVITARNVVGLINGTRFPYFRLPTAEWERNIRQTTASGTYPPDYFSYAGPGYYSEEAIAISAHYDSFSYIPSLAPGADESTDISTLLEMAKYFSANKPERTMEFIAFSGYGQFDAGSRAYVQKYWYSLPGIRAHIDLDYSADGSTHGIMFSGDWWPVYFGWPMSNYHPVMRAGELTNTISNKYMPNIEKQLGKKYVWDNGVIADYQRFVPTDFYLNVEAINLAGVTAVTYRTTRTMRALWKTPFDTPDRVNYDNLRPQVEFAYLTIASFANDPDKFYTQTWLLRNWDGNGGFSNLTLWVREWNSSLGEFTPVPNALVYLQLISNPVFSVGERGSISVMSTAYEFDNQMVVKTGEDGKVQIGGVIGASASAFSYATAGPITYTYSAVPFVMNPDTGAILEGPDMGVYGGRFPLNFIVVEANYSKTIATFKCSSLIALDLLDYRSFGGNLRIYPLNFETHDSPIQFGTIPSEKGHMMFFMKPNEPVEIYVEDATLQAVMLLNNASDQHPEGFGYRASEGKTIYIPNIPAEAALSMTKLDFSRYERNARYGIVLPESVKFRQISAEEYSKFEEYLRSGNIMSAYGAGVDSLQAEIRGYRSIKGGMQDAILTIFVFYIILIPFVYIFERLVFAFEGTKSFVAMAAIFAAFMIPLYIFHPGFYVAANTPTVLLGATILTLTTPPVMILFTHFAGFLGSMRKKVLGAHFTEISRTSATVAALSIGVQNMRKRKLRTGLMLSALILIGFSLCMLTSTTVAFIGAGVTVSGKPLYDGLFIRRIVYEPMPWQTAEYLQAEFPDATVAPRLWGYTPRQTVTMSSSSANITLDNYASFLALSPQEPTAEIIMTISTNSSRWFDEYDLWSVFISDETAQKLGVQLGDKVNVNGIEFTVKGIFDSTAMESVVDLDQKSILPIDLLSGPDAIMAGRRVPARMTAIIPLKTGRALNFQMWTIAIKVPETSKLEEKAAEMGLKSDFDIYVADTGQISNYRQVTIVTTQGWNMLAMPMAISILIAMNMVLASVYERKTHISIYSSLGLSPRHITFMFLAEILTYALVGAVMGYIPGVITNIVLFQYKLLPPEFYPNSSSTYVLYSIGFLVAAIMAASIYPLIAAARLVTPSAERAWAIPTKPRGDEWSIPLPLTVKDKAEAKAALSYVEEYTRSLASVRTANFNVESWAYREEETADRSIVTLDMHVRIAPWDAAVSQEAQLRGISMKGEEYNFAMYLRRKTGIISVWKKSNYNFLDSMRKQLLLWKGLDPNEKAKYYQKELQK